MLTGEIPMGRFAPPSKKVRIDVQLDEVVLRTLEREPELRYQRAVDVKSDVEAIGAGAQIHARGSAPARRLSWLAVAAPAVAFGVPMAASLLLTAVLFMVPAELVTGSGGASAGVNAVYMAYAFFSLLGMAVGCALGWRALERIRERWPRLFGVGAALAGLWFLPLAACGSLLVAATQLASLAAGAELPPWIAGAEVALLAALGLRWVARRRSRVLAELAAPS